MKDCWDLGKIYPTEEAFLADLEKLKSFIPKIKEYKGRLKDDEVFADYLRNEKEISDLLNHLYMFAAHRADLDRRNVQYGEDESKVILAMQSLMAESSFESPEVLSLGEEHVKKFFEKHPELSEFDFSYKKLFHDQDHVLSGDKESLLSNFEPITEAGSNLYSSLSVSDYKGRNAKLEDGSEVLVNVSNWTSLIAAAKSAKDREAIFEALYLYFDERKNTYGEIYNASVQAELAEMKSRGYKSILESHLHHNNIPVEVFHNLIEVASNGSEPLKKYYRLRAKYLGLEKHRSYDRFIQLERSEKKYTYEEARDLFFASLERYPEDYKEKAREVLKEGYVDVYPHEGKRSGAYSSGGEGIHPYILLNFEGELDDVFTVAHESGHSVHTLYSMEAQPIMKQNYTIFVAEIASTFNEHNLLDYLIEKGDLDRKTKIALLQKAIDEICSTFYRQTLFANYEYDIACKAERGEPINYQVLNDEMKMLYEKYYGIDIEEEKYKPMVWAYIPHLFYTPFYVYQYATSFTASMLLYEKVKEGDPKGFDNFIGLLKKGGSDYPIDEVLSSGVNLTTKEPFEAVVKRMETLVDELEKVLFEEE